MELLTSSESVILTPALRTVGNIVTGDDTQTDAIIGAGGLPHLGALLHNQRNNIVKEAAWAISNITAGNTEQIQHVIDAGLIPPLINVLRSVSYTSIIRIKESAEDRSSIERFEEEKERERERYNCFSDKCTCRVS